MGVNERMRTGTATSASLPPDENGCGEWGNELTLFVDGELGEAERTALEVHLDGCPRCQEVVDFTLALHDHLRETTRDATPAPADFRRRLRAVLAEEAAPAALSPWAQLRRLWSPVPAAAAGATALGITAWLWFGGSTDDIVREIVARHARHLPLEVQTSDPRQVQAWSSDKVDFRLNVPPVTFAHGAQLILMGARLSHVRDHSAVQVMYGTPQSPSQRVTMLVFDDPSTRPPVRGIPHKVDNVDVYTENRAGYNVAVWKQNEVVYSLVSDDEDDVVDSILRAHP